MSSNVKIKKREMVEVFKTNVHEVEATEMLIEKLLEHFPESRINFDLEDCDRILRVEEKNIPVTICPKKIIELVQSSGYHCEVLD